MPFKKLTRDSFAQIFIDAGRRCGSFRTRSIVGPSLTLDAESMFGRLCLENAYEEYLSAPVWKRHSVFGRLVKEFGKFESHEELGSRLTREHLMPHVKERMVLAQIELDADASTDPTGGLTYRPMGEHLALEVVFDHGGAMLPASASDLADLGLSFDDALDVANRNLLKRGTRKFNSPRPGLYVSDWNDRYDASRMHLSEVVPNLPVRGRHVVMTPNRDTLLVTGANDVMGLRMMAEIAASALQHARPMNGFAYRLDARWTPWLPDQDRPYYALFKKLAVESEAAYYGEQLEHQKAIRTREGRDICLPGVKIDCDYLNDRWTSQTTWILGMPCLLPRADSIVVARLDCGRKPIPLGVLDWETIKAEAPDLLTPVGLYPERYRVSAETDFLDLVRIGMKPAETVEAEI